MEIPIARKIVFILKQGNVILTKFSLLSALEVVKMTTYNAASD